MTILKDIFLYIIMLFLDNVGIKKLYIKYNNEEILPEVRRFVFEYIQILDIILKRLEHVRACIDTKS